MSQCRSLVSTAVIAHTSAMRERACVALVRLEEQLSLIRDELLAADESEHIERATRGAMAKVQSVPLADRRRA